MKQILLLGGTAEATQLAHILGQDGRWRVVLSLAGVTRAPVLPQGVESRIGGFGGAEGLARWISRHGISALVDATHPFATHITRNAAMAAQLSGCPCLRVERPAWVRQPGDRWHLVSDMEHAARYLAGLPARRVFLTIGRKEVQKFRQHANHHHYIIRSVNTPPAALLPAHAVVIEARGPFLAEAELTLLLQHRVELVVTKNSGAEAVYGKIEAARLLGLGVVMVDRPPAPGPLHCVSQPQEVPPWLEETLGAL